MSDSSKKGPSIPSWQQTHKPEDNSASTEHPHTSDSTAVSSYAETLEQAREFLKDESIRDAPRERKTAFLEKKGLQASDIETLLVQDSAASESEETDELKTVHDSNKDDIDTAETTQTPIQEPQAQSTTTQSSNPPERPQRDVPPIITYPEFLLKPQKPPPLITIDRLIKGTYAFGALATLTYSASKYIIEPMLETLNDARHLLASTTITNLEQLNSKLESTVSHVPYIASAAVRKSQDQDRNRDHNDDDDDGDSVTSDPTELFHRDIATQTSPGLSRAPSDNGDDGPGTDTISLQWMRISAQNDRLLNLTENIYPTEGLRRQPPAHKKLHDTIAEFQAILDKLEMTHNPLRGDYYSSNGGGGSSSGVLASQADKTKAGKDTDMAAKVRAEIRNLKGAFLSARNFPTAPRPVNAYTQR